jgi:plastocyanin
VATTTTAPAADNSFVITINGDNSTAPQFDPPAAAVAVGSVVKFVNADSKEHSVVDQKSAFRSPPIPPGGSWKYKAVTPGEYNYQDGTRPYAVGRLEVR